MGVGHSWNEDDKRKKQASEKTLSLCHLAQHNYENNRTPARRRAAKMIS